MQRLEVSGAVRPIYGSLGVKRQKNGSAKPTATEDIFYSPISDCELQEAIQT